MGGPLLALSVLAGMAAGAERLEPRPDRATEFAAPAPEAVDDVSRWEVVGGEFGNAQVTGAYRFYVNPGHPGLYQLMRYRVSLPAQRRNRATEKLVWNRHPGERAPLLCWERVEAAGGEAAHWRALSPGTPEYVAEMWVLIQVLSLHQSARTGREPGGEGDP